MLQRRVYQTDAFCNGFRQNNLRGYMLSRHSIFFNVSPNESSQLIWSKWYFRKKKRRILSNKRAEAALKNVNTKLALNAFEDGEKCNEFFPISQLWKKWPEQVNWLTKRISLWRIGGKKNIDRNSKSFKFKRNRLMCSKHLTASTKCKLKTTWLNCSRYFNWIQWIRNNNTTAKKEWKENQHNNKATERSKICEYRCKRHRRLEPLPSPLSLSFPLHFPPSHPRVLCSKCDNRLICFKFTTLTFSIWCMQTRESIFLIRKGINNLYAFFFSSVRFFFDILFNCIESYLNYSVFAEAFCEIVKRPATKYTDRKYSPYVQYMFGDYVFGSRPDSRFLAIRPG